MANTERAETCGCGPNGPCDPCLLTRAAEEARREAAPQCPLPAVGSWTVFVRTDDGTGVHGYDPAQIKPFPYCRHHNADARDAAEAHVLALPNARRYFYPYADGAGDCRVRCGQPALAPNDPRWHAEAEVAAHAVQDALRALVHLTTEAVGVVQHLGNEPLILEMFDDLRQDLEDERRVVEARRDGRPAVVRRSELSDA